MADVPKAKAPSKASAMTVLVLGEVEIPVGLYKAHADAGKLAPFDTAGPNGGVLRARPMLVERLAEPADAVKLDPLGPGPGQDGPVDAGQGVRVDAGYGRELVEEGTDETVAPDEVRRGVRLEDGRFIDCTEQLAEITERTRLERMEILGFISNASIPRARVAGAYYVGAGDERAPKPLRLILEALKRERRSAVVKWTKRSRQSLGALGWLGGCLMLYEIVWAECFRPAPRQALAVSRAEVSEAEVEVAAELVRSMADVPGMVDGLRDDAIRLREELRERALAGEVPDVIVPEFVNPDAELMAQLEASLVAAVA